MAGKCLAAVFPNGMRDFVFDNDGGILYITTDGGLLTGVVENTEDPSLKWGLNIYLEGKEDWQGWSGQMTIIPPEVPRSF